MEFPSLAQFELNLRVSEPRRRCEALLESRIPLQKQPKVGSMSHKGIPRVCYCLWMFCGSMFLLRDVSAHPHVLRFFSHRQRSGIGSCGCVLMSGHSELTDFGGRYRLCRPRLLEDQILVLVAPKFQPFTVCTRVEQLKISRICLGAKSCKARRIQEDLLPGDCLRRYAW